MKLVVYILFYLYLRESEAFLQEFAKVIYYNPKYVESPKAITSRVNRREPYRTNITVTLLYPWGNNVTFQLTYNLAGIGTDFKWTKKVCDVIEYNWMIDVFKLSSIKLSCPMPAQAYSIYKLEFPPKNFPLPVPKGDTSVSLAFYLTDNMERLLEFGIHIKNQ